MRARLVLALAAVVAAGGCKAEEKPSAARGAAEPEGETAPVTPFTGALTAVQLEQAVKKVLPHQPWAKAWAALRSTVGDPTRVDGDLHGWYVLEGDQCHFLEVTRDGERGEVGSSSSGAADAQTPSYFAKCNPDAKPPGAGVGAAAAPGVGGEGEPPSGGW